jgi:translation initiation factor IF-3
MKKTKQKSQNRARINHQIKISPIRLIDKDGNQVGVVSTDRAKEMAKKDGLDLVEVASDAKPPVCRIMDYGKFRYDQKTKDKENKRKSKVVEVKQLRLRPKIASNDIEVKVKAAQKFLSQGKKVQFNLQYKGRDLAHKDEGFKVMNKIIEALCDDASVEQEPKLDGRRLICKLEPK